jgi:hypothetical protein
MQLRVEQGVVRICPQPPCGTHAAPVRHRSFQRRVPTRRGSDSDRRVPSYLFRLSKPVRSPQNSCAIGFETDVGSCANGRRPLSPESAGGTMKRLRYHVASPTHP